MKRLQYITFLFILTLSLNSSLIYIAQAQQETTGPKTVVLLNGKVTDERSGEPVFIKLYFVDKSGNKTSATTNKTDGAFQVVLKPNSDYKVRADNFIIPEELSKYSTPNVSEYAELTKNFSGLPLTTGMEFFRVNMFNANSKELAKSSSHVANKINDLIKDNPKLNLNITISTEDSYFKSIVKKVKVDDPNNSKKKKTEKITTTSEQQLKELAESRLKEIKSLFSSMGIPMNKIEFETDIKSAPSAKKPSKKVFVPNLFVSVGRVFQ